MHWFLSLALLASGATSWRERGEFGPGEVIYALGLILTLSGIKDVSLQQSRSWLRFAFFGSVGLILGTLIHVEGNFDLAHRLKPGLAWIFALAGGVVLATRPTLRASLSKVFAPMCLTLLSGCWMAALLPGCRGVFYFQDFRFCALSANPNQTAVFLLCLPWLVGQRWWLMAWILFLGLSTGSDSLLLAWLVGALGSVWERRSSWRWLAILILGLVLWASLGRFTRPPADYVRLSNARENVTTRTTLALHGIQAWSASPWVGWGPGAYSGELMPFEAFEAHNSWVDWATNAGLIGLLAYLQLVFYHGRWLARRGRLSPFLALLVFSTFQYTFRQPIFWMSWWLCASEADPNSEEARGEK